MDESSKNNSFTAFLREILRKKYGEEYGEEYVKDIESNPDSSHIRNLRRELKGKLEGLGYKDILENESYVQGNKKIFPKYILAFFEVLLLLPSGKKNYLGSKIKNGRFDEITEDEIENFEREMRESFQAYGKSIAVEGLDSNRKKS